jgi:alpha-galactosidase
VEVPATVDATGVRPQSVGDLPPQCAALNRQFLSVVDLTVRAAVEGRPEFIRQALLADPNTAATLRVEDMWALADDMVDAHAQLLPEALRAPLAP